MAKKKRRQPLPERIPQKLAEALQMGVESGRLPSPSMYALAKRSRFTQQALSNYAGGVRPTSLSVLQRFADALDIDVDVVFSERVAK